jgi:membrane protease subunit HflC
VQRLLIIILIVVVFLAFMVTYTVRFTEKAVVTTFGRADEKSVITTPGLRFKVPYIQQVTKYDARARYLESNQETQMTADDSPILVTAYVTWRVEDPLKFFRKFSAAGETPKDHYKEAEKVLKSKLRSAMGEVSRYRFGELFSSEDKGSKLSDLEKRLLDNVDQASTSDGALSDYGIKAMSVGITRLGLPQNATRDVFARMNAERKKIADKAIAEGKARAEALRSGADSEAKKIRSFADRLADRIRNQGDVEAAEWVKKLDADPKLAVFIQNIDLMKKAIGGRTTLVLPTSLPGLGLFRPDAMKNVKAGEVPAVELEGMNRPAAKPAAAVPDASKPAGPEIANTPAQGGQR